MLERSVVTRTRRALLLPALLFYIPAAAGASDPVYPWLPLDARRAAQARGNLIENGGFERGRAGWRLTGAGIAEKGAFDGKRALHLRAPRGGEARAEGEAAVIPGEHVLTAAVRLSGIAPAPGERVSDRLRVRVVWLDRDRKPLPLGPLRGAGRMFEPGERPFPLYFLRDAASFPWRRAVFLSSFTNPSQEDAPAGAAYARIAFTLRGPGEAWIDDVRFTYSRRNFTLAERIEPYRRLDDDSLGRVIPQPRLLDERGPVIPLRRLCLNAPHPLLAGLDERLHVFEERLRALGASAVHGVARGGCDARVVFSSLGASATRGLGPEGYTIDTRRDAGGRPEFVLAGVDARGAVYALETLRQLLRPAPGGGAALLAVTVRDWPAFRGRPVSESDPSPTGARRLQAAPRWMAGAKLNRLYLNYPLTTVRWWEAPRSYTDLVDALGARARRTGLFTLGVLVNPYFQRADPDVTDTFQVSRPEDTDILWRTIRRALDAGAGAVMLCADDFTPSWGHDRLEYDLTDPADRRRFGSLAAAHGALARRLNARIRARAPRAAFLFVPPWYNEMFREWGGGFAEDYLEDIGRDLPRDVGVVWTGPAVRSLAVDGVSIERFSRSIGRRPLVLWDNTLYAVEMSPYYGASPLRARLASFFEPFAIDAEGLKDVSRDGEIYVNGHSGGRYVVKMTTVADFLWNPEAYDPDRSLWRGMVARWGRAGAARVVAWDAAYWEERNWINRLAGSRGGFTKDDRAHLAAARGRSAARWNDLVRSLRGHDDDLLQDLAAARREQEARFREASHLAGAH